MWIELVWSFRFRAQGLQRSLVPFGAYGMMSGSLAAQNRASFSSRSGRLCRLCLVGNWRIVSYSVFFWSPATTHTHMHSLWSTGQCVCVCSCLRSAIRKPPDAGFGGSVNDCVCFRIHFFYRIRARESLVLRKVKHSVDIGTPSGCTIFPRLKP